MAFARPLALALASAVALLIGVGTASAQTAKPTENKGLTVADLASYDLGKQGLDDYKSRQFRARKITLAPGGVGAYHSHADRPAVAYVLTGTIIEHRDGAPDRTLHSGDVIIETTDVKHWAENKGTTEAVIIGVDLFKP
jgi:quercetin dioxygenase-like cupin family protein